MQRFRAWKNVLVFLLSAGLLSLFPGAALAQAPCGVVDSIGFPVDTTAFRIVQDFGAPSERHDGRFHTGEDWFGGRDAYGTPVRAIAAGRVTYSWPLGWGRDGGVVMLEHTFPDGSLAYSMYGHMEATEDYPFPGKFACVRQGEIVGVVGNARPAPHLHFEIRSNQGTDPGPGYTWENPVMLGWLRPSEFVIDWQAWLQPAHRWHLTLLDEAGPITPPVELPDHSLLYLDTYRLRGITPDGRILWRLNLDHPAVSVTLFGGDALLAYADGAMQPVINATLSASYWQTGYIFDGAPIVDGDALILHTAGNSLVAFGADRQTVIWQLDNVPPIVRIEVAAQVIGLMTVTDELLAISHQGQLLDRTLLRDGASMATAPDGTLLVYSSNGLWRVLADGTKETVLDNAPPGSSMGAVSFDERGGLYLYDGSVLHAYDSQRNPVWQVALPVGVGQSELDSYGDVLLLTGTHGSIIAIQQSSSGICGQLNIYGSRRAKAWHSLGDDGILRVAVGDQLLGLDWRTLLGGCA